MIQVLILIFFTVLSITSFAQNSIIGNWKPVFMEIDSVMKVDLRTNKTEYSKALEKMVVEKGISKQMLDIMKTLFVEKIKDANEAFLANGTHIVSASKSKTNITTTYTYDAKTKMLTIQDAKNKMNQVFKVEFSKVGFTTTGEMKNPINGKNAKMKIMYEKA